MNSLASRKHKPKAMLYENWLPDDLIGSLLLEAKAGSAIEDEVFGEAEKGFSGGSSFYNGTPKWDPRR